jgi:hypothetical protein
MTFSFVIKNINVKARIPEEVMQQLFQLSGISAVVYFCQPDPVNKKNRKSVIDTDFLFCFTIKLWLQLICTWASCRHELR